MYDIKTKWVALLSVSLDQLLLFYNPDITIRTMEEVLFYKVMMPERFSAFKHQCKKNIHIKRQNCFWFLQSGAALLLVIIVDCNEEQVLCAPKIKIASFTIVSIVEQLIPHIHVKFTSFFSFFKMLNCAILWLFFSSISSTFYIFTIFSFSV